MGAISVVMQSPSSTLPILEAYIKKREGKGLKQTM